MRYLLLVIPLLLLGCATGESIAEAVQQMVADGTLSMETAKQVKEAAEAGEWDRVIELGGTAIASILGSLGFTRLWRGSTENRKGTAPGAAG